MAAGEIWPAYRYHIGAGVLENWHIYKLNRDSEGNWKLFIDDSEVTGFNPPADSTYKTFNRISIYCMRAGSKLDWIKLYQVNRNSSNAAATVVMN